MRFRHLTPEEKKSAFEAALLAAEAGVPPNTSYGLDPDTLSALMYVAAATDSGKRARASADARRTFADEISGMAAKRRAMDDYEQVLREFRRKK